MEVLFFNLSLNLRFPLLSAGSELPSSLTTSNLADLRSTAFLQSSLLVRLLNFSYVLADSRS